MYENSLPSTGDVRVDLTCLVFTFADEIRSQGTNDQIQLLLESKDGKVFTVILNLLVACPLPCITISKGGVVLSFIEPVSAALVEW